jgi:hypothetical protein
VELSWLTKLRITWTLALGVFGLGFAAWPLVAPMDPLDIISASHVDLAAALVLLGLSAFIGFIAYFIAWPYGSQIGVLAVPAGLAVWALRSDGIFKLMQKNPTVTERLGVYAALRWDSLFWLALVGVGLVGLWVASKVRPCPPCPNPLQVSKPKSKASLDLIATLLIGLAIGYVLVSVLAQGTRVIGISIPTQPATAQIAFAVMAAFGAAGFVSGKFLGVGPFWSTVTSAALPTVANLLYAKVTFQEPLSLYYPATCFTSPVLAVLPVQMVAFGALGATAGYWMAVRVKYWHIHQMA